MSLNESAMILYSANKGKTVIYIYSTNASLFGSARKGNNIPTRISPINELGRLKHIGLELTW